MAWTEVVDPATNSQAFERKLGTTEYGFYWDSVFNRTADVAYHAEVQLRGNRSTHIFDPSHIRSVWARLKSKYPLLAARTEERGDDVFFVVSRERLETIGPRELVFGSVEGRDDAYQAARKLVTTEWDLSQDLLAQIHFLQALDGQTFHLIIHIAHLITDGTSNVSLVRSFLEELSSLDGAQKYNLPERLRLATPLEALFPSVDYTAAKRRWHRAIGLVIAHRRMSKISGGHTLPRTISPATSLIPAVSRKAMYTFPPEVTPRLVQVCRENKTTFGSAHTILAQVAFGRALMKQVIEGKISEEEWNFRTSEPTVSAGPLNFRPYLKREWQEAGGKQNVAVIIGFFFYRLPAIPGGTIPLSKGADLPSFDAILSKPRFFLRCQLVKKQADAYLKHPLVTDLALGYLPQRNARLRQAGRAYRKSNGVIPDSVSQAPLSLVEQAQSGLVSMAGGSSFGNTDLILPRLYRMENGQGEFHLTHNEQHLHCRPGELYFGSATNGGRLSIYVFWDDNVYDAAIVEDWLDEIKKAVEYYLS